MIDALRRFVPGYLDQHRPSDSTCSTLELLLRCRTPALGGHRHDCDNCGYSAIHYNSCRSRYCPQCQGARRHRWLEAQQALLLPVPHFQVVFTLPAELRGIAKMWPREVYDVLFQASQLTLQKLAATRWDATLGILAVLHTWTRELKFHPHVHCVVTGGGLTQDGGWVHADRDFLFPVATMRRLFRGVFLSLLAKRGLPLEAKQRRQLRSARRHKNWVVYVEAPEDRDPAHLVKYLARYVYQTAISNARMVAVSEYGVTFRTRGDAVTTLPGVEFVRRFGQHFLPPRFRKIRAYGLLAPGARARLAMARHVLTETAPADDAPAPPGLVEGLVAVGAHRCPTCGDPLRVQLIPRSAPSMRPVAPAQPARAPP